MIRYAPFLFWIGVIFFLSSEQGAMTQTSRIIGPILHFIFPAASEETLQIYHGYIRKLAHFTEYSILALLAFRAFSTSTNLRVRSLRYLLPVIIVLLIASTDEFNQSFEASRTSSIRDVLLDLSGGIVTATAIWVFYRLRRAPEEKTM